MIYVFNSFPIIWVMTQGGPDNGTHILVTYLYELGFRLGRPGEAAAVSLIMLVMLFVFSIAYLGEPVKWNYLAGFAFMTLAAFFIFHKW